MKFLLIGLDEGFSRRGLGYTDTIIIFLISPLKRNAVMFSIPRDLWIPITEWEEDHICVVYKIAEAKQSGTGALELISVVNKIFRIQVQYYLLVRMQSFIRLIDNLGGVNIMHLGSRQDSPAGKTNLNGSESLAFARDRAESDDFARMMQGQELIREIIRAIFSKGLWRNPLQLLKVYIRDIESNIPFWELPRFAWSIFYSYLNGLDGFSITREMVGPRITSQGEQVMEPDWKKIRSLIKKAFKN